MTEVIDRKGVLNTIYQSVLLASTSVAYSWLLRKLLKVKIGDPGSADLEDILKLSAVVAISNDTLDYFYTMGLPKNPAS